MKQLLSILIIITISLAQEAVGKVELNETSAVQSLNGHFEIASGAEGQTFEDRFTMTWTKPQKIPASFGYSKEKYWAKVEIDNTSKFSLPFVLESNMNLYWINVFQTQSNVLIASNVGGARRGNQGRRYPSFILQFPPGKSELHIQTSSIIPTFDFSLYSPSKALLKQSREFLWLGGYVGILFFLIAYNGLKCLMVSRRVFLEFTLMLVCVTMFLLFSNGIGFVINEGFGKFLAHTNASLYGLTAVFAMRFVNLFCRVENVKLVRVMSRFFYIPAAILVFGQFFAEHLVYQIFNPFFALLAVQMIGTAIYQTRNGYSPAAYLLLAMCLVISAVLINLASIYGLLPMNSIFHYGVPIGFIAFNTVLTLGLGKIISIELKEKMNEIISEKKGKLHSYKQLEKVFYPHQLKAMMSGKPLESTMPCGDNYGFVITFDIQKSSTYKDPAILQAFRQVFSRCYDVMNEGYDEDHLVSLAYRVKELGDGFICSINYPFQVPGANAAEEALRAAESFAEIFNQEVSGFDQGIYCSMGIAYGPLKSYYPESGPKEFDLSGDAIVLSTRYESLRSEIFKFAPVSSIITLHEKVFSQLSLDSRRKFIEVDIVSKKIFVRNDPNAKKVFYRIMNPEAASRESQAS